MATVFKRRDRDLWCTSFLSPNGKRVYRYSKSRAEAEALTPSARPDAPQFKTTIREFLSSLQVRESTLVRYQIEITALKQCIGRQKMDADGILNVVCRVQKFPPAKAARLFRRLKSLVLFAGVPWPPRLKCHYKYTPGRAIPKTEVRRILHTTEKEFPLCYPLLCFLLDTGCRVGEALALNWGDYDGRAVNITRTYSEANKGPKMAPVKTVAGNRRLVLSRQLNAILRPLRGCDGQPLFQTQRGCRMRVVNLWNRWWKRVCGGYRIHDVRHTNATFLLGKQDAREVGARLGHAHAGITHRLYDHMVLLERPVQHTLLPTARIS